MAERSQGEVSLGHTSSFSLGSHPLTERMVTSKTRMASALCPYGPGTEWLTVGMVVMGRTPLKETFRQPVPRRKGLTQHLPAGTGARCQAGPVTRPLPGEGGSSQGASGRVPVNPDRKSTRLNSSH